MTRIYVLFMAALAVVTALVAAPRSSAVALTWNTPAGGEVNPHRYPPSLALRHRIPRDQELLKVGRRQIWRLGHRLPE